VGSLSSLIECLKVRPGAYPRVEHLVSCYETFNLVTDEEANKARVFVPGKHFQLGLTFADKAESLTFKCQTALERLVRQNAADYLVSLSLMKKEAN
jgi:hypothetical protein